MRLCSGKMWKSNVKKKKEEKKITSFPTLARWSAVMRGTQVIAQSLKTQRSRLRRPISKIRLILPMDAKIWMVPLIIMFTVRPICAQDTIFKMSSVSPETRQQNGPKREILQTAINTFDY